MSDDSKYIFVTGGVMSGIGKGISAASIGRLLENCGLDVTAVKVDPYINVDAGTMNPFQHGEVYVLDDGTEVDLDLGTYERFLDRSMSAKNNITTGQVYREVIQSERDGDYLGKTVQIIPHITDKIKSKIMDVGDEADVCIVEIGGTVGDIEGMPFLESIRQMKLELDEDDATFVHVTLVPESQTGEQKTKPTQHSVKELRSIGIQPSIIIGRSEEELQEHTKEKISMFCDVSYGSIFSNPDMEDIHTVPIFFEQRGLHSKILDELDTELTTNGNNEWTNVVQSPENTTVSILIAGKYDMDDAYYSIHEALKHSGFKHDTKVRRLWTKTDDIKEKNKEVMQNADGIIVPGGFGSRGFEGKVRVCQYAREENIPYLGICLGFQSSVVEYARNVIHLSGANTTEADDDTNHPVIDILPEQEGKEETGDSMRLGLQRTEIDTNTIAHRLYEKKNIERRHRHRYEVNPKYIDELEDGNLKFSGRSGRRMEILELQNHPYYIGTQYHPEFFSRPTSISPVFDGLIESALE
jgi:CTP synthase